MQYLCCFALQCCTQRQPSVTLSQVLRNLTTSVVIRPCLATLLAKAALAQHSRWLPTRLSRAPLHLTARLRPSKTSLSQQRLHPFFMGNIALLFCLRLLIAATSRTQQAHGSQGPKAWFANRRGPPILVRGSLIPPLSAGHPVPWTFCFCCCSAELSARLGQGCGFQSRSQTQHLLMP